MNGPSGFEDLEKLLNFSISGKMLNLVFVFSLLVGLVLLAMLIVSAIVGKKSRGLLIAAGTISFVATLLTKTYLKMIIEMSSATVITGTSESEVMSRLYQFFMELSSSAFVIGILGMLFFVGWILILIAIVKNKKSDIKAVKVLMIFALLIQIANFLFYVPMPIQLYVIANVIGMKREIVQVIYDIIRYILLLLPPLFILISSILEKVKASKQKQNIVVDEPSKNVPEESAAPAE